MSHLTEFNGKKLHSVTRGDLELGELEDAADKQAHDKVAEESKDLVERVKAALADSVSDVRVTSRLTDTPACVVAGEGEMSTQITKLTKSCLLIGLTYCYSKPCCRKKAVWPIHQRLLNSPIKCYWRV